MRVDPFPYALLPRLRRGDWLDLRQVRAHLGGEAAAALGRWASRLAGPDSGAGVDLRVGSVQRLEGEAVACRRAASAVSFSLRGPDGLRAYLLFDGKLAAGLLEIALGSGPLPLPGTPTPAEEGLLAYLACGLLLELGPEFSWSLAVGDPEGPPGEAEEWVAVEGQVILPREAGGRGVLLVERAALLRAPRGEARERRGRLGRLAGALCDLPVAIGRFRLPSTTVVDLGPGDVILPRGCPRQGAELEGLLEVGRGGFPILVAGTRVRVAAPFRRGGFGMASSETDQTTVAEELEVDLTIELGRLRLSGARVLDLAPGDVVALDRPVASHVDLRVGDRLIARGELVDVEGEAGVRLIEVFD